MRHVKFISGILAVVCTVSTLLTGCATQQQTAVETIPYDPYGFTPRQFVEEGGWEVARTGIEKNLAQLYCEWYGVVIDGTNYEDILSISGQDYYFNEATLMGAVYVKNNPNNNSKDMANINNWLDLVYYIPIESETKVPPAKILVRATNISRTEDGEYVCVSMGGAACSSYGYQLQTDINLQSYYVTNNEKIKEEIDYGLLAWSNETNEFRKLSPHALELEDKRLNAYLRAREKNTSLYFSTMDYTPCSTSNYTVDFDSKAIVSDLQQFALGFGMISEDYESVPTKKKDFEKAGWIRKTVNYTIQDDAQTVQEYFRGILRDQYFVCNTTRWAFAAEINEEKGIITIDLCANINPITTSTE